MKTSSKSRLFRGGYSVNTPKFRLSEEHILTLERLELEPEGMLERSTIADQFEASFFETDFWLMWWTTFAFRPWHSAVEFKRYLVRFTHSVRLGHSREVDKAALHIRADSSPKHHNRSGEDACLLHCAQMSVQ